MIQQIFDISKFEPFQTSSGLDGIHTGTYDGKVVRIIQKDRHSYKHILEISNEIASLVKSKLFYKDDDVIVIEHEKLENITYYTEWTKQQRVIAAIAIVSLQSELSQKGFYLNDPHAFNITFRFSTPIYFDFGSIKEGKISPAWWFIKCFCGWMEMDYWDSVLKISRLKKVWISNRIKLSKNPYDYLIKKLKAYEMGFIEKKIIGFLNHKGFAGKLTRRALNSLPSVFKSFSNWTDYEQKSPSLNFDNERNKNILDLFKKYTPDKILDIGANRGAFSLLALENGAQEAIALDLDNHSLDYLFNIVKQHQRKITIAKLNLMSYPERPGYYHSYFPAHERLQSEFTICLAVVHHVCYFGNFSFEEFAERLNRFSKKILVVEFVPYDDIHLTGTTYNGKDRSWYTLDNFIKTMKKWFPNEHEIFPSTPRPRLLIKFTK